MAQKLTGVYEYLKDKKKLLKGYRIHLAKKAVQDIVGFNEETKLKITYEKRKNYYRRRKVKKNISVVRTLVG